MPEGSLLVCPFTCRWKEEEGGVEDGEKEELGKRDQVLIVCSIAIVL